MARLGRAADSGRRRRLWAGALLLLLAVLLAAAMAGTRCSPTGKHQAPATVRVAAVQMHSLFGRPAANRARMERLARQAAARGARIIVFPEAAVPGYMSADGEIWTDPQTRPGEGRSLAGVAEPADGESVRRFAALARELKVCIVVPFIERDEAAGKYYNAQVLVGPDGRTLAHYRKLNPWPGAEATWASRGDLGAVAADVPLGRVGLLVCYDIHSVPRELVGKGAGTLLWSVAMVGFKPEDWFGENLPARARSLGVNLVAANWTFPPEARPADRGYGYSRIIDRTGRVLAAARDECAEEVVIADLPVAPPPGGPGKGNR